VEFEEVETKSYGDPVSFEIPLQNLLIKNFYIKDIQEQPALVWWSYYQTKDQFDFEWGKYPNAKFVKNVADISKEENDTFFKTIWQEDCDDKAGYLVLRYYNKYQDLYRVIANGVELYNGPMLWVDITTHDGRKMYPFAKEIFEPFAQGSFFFYGNSMVNAGMGEGDVINTLYNTALDKTYRSMVPPLLVGMVNKDMLDLEDEVVAGDTKIYVENVEQVKQMEIKGISDSDVKMIQLVSNGFNMTTLDPSQEGQAEKYVTARAAVAADERARQLKGVLFMFLESLWLQKTRLRIPNILFSYTKPLMVEVLGDKGQKMWEARYRNINVEGAELSDGAKGTLSIQFAGSQQELQGMKPELEKEEASMQREGRQFEKIGVMYDYLERFCYDVQVLPATLWQSSQALAMSLTVEKIGTVAKLFPEYFQANKEKFFRELVRRYDDTPEGYDYPEPMTLELQMQMAGAEPGGKKEMGAPNGGLTSDITGNDSNNSLAKLTGVQQ
jgi:hypothetical protein